MDTSISSFPPLVYAYLKQVSKPDEEIKYRAVYIIETLIVDVGHNNVNDLNQRAK